MTILSFMMQHFGIVFDLFNREELNTNTMKHIFSEKIEFGAYYSYNNKQKKVYDVEGMKRDFKNLLEKLKRRCL